ALVRPAPERAGLPAVSADPGAAGPLEVRLLGHFRLSREGRPLHGVATGRLQSLLAYLLLHADAPRPRAHLSFTFWPEAPESTASITGSSTIPSTSGPTAGSCACWR